MGSSLSKGIDAATSIVTGLITGDITGGLAGASAPYLAEQIKLKTGHEDPKTGEWQTDDKAANLTAHALLGAAVAIAQGNSALAGGAGALAGEAAADFIREKLYDKNVKDLSEAEKENISALAQLAVGLAVAAGTGGNTNDVGTAVAGSKNAVENNALAVLQMSIAQMQQSTAAMLGMQGSNKNANEQMALAVEEALRNMGKLASDTYEKLTEEEKVKFVNGLVKDMTPEQKAQVQQQVKLDIERNQIAMGNRPKVESMNDYLANNAYGKALSNYLKIKSYDSKGDPIYEAIGYGYDKFIGGNDQVKLNSNKDALMVYDSAGNIKTVLNLDGTKNDYLTNLHSEISATGSLRLPGYPIPEPLPPLPGLVIPEKDKDAGKFVTPIVEKDKDEGKFITPIVEQDKDAGIYAGPEIDVGDWKNNIYTADKPYEPNQGAVGNMGEFLGKPGFGSDVKDNSTKTKQQYGGQSIYVANGKIEGTDIKKGDQFYLDGLHKDHIEVFDSKGKFKFVLNLDGSVNKAKTDQGQGRRLPK